MGNHISILGYDYWATFVNQNLSIEIYLLIYEQIK